MVKQPRPPRPDPTDSEETVELLRALARQRGVEPADEPEAYRAREPGADDDERVASLRALATRLGAQLRWHTDRSDESPASDAPPFARRGGLAGEWRAFLAGLPTRAALVPRLRRERLAFVVIAVAVLAIAAAGRMIGIPRAGHGVAIPGQIVPPTESGPREPTAPDIAAISRAMAQCEDVAARNPDTLAFLVVPVVRVGAQTHDWRALAIEKVGDAYLLLSANDGLDGLRDGSLAVRPGRYTFSVLDPSSGATYSWTSATGMSRLERPDSAAIKTLQLGFDFSAAQTGPHWSKLFQRKSGSCYWVVVVALG
jgi:hypothetical protein